MPFFRDLLQSLGPTWLVGRGGDEDDEGKLVIGSLLVMCDVYAERMRQAALVRFPSFAPDDALPAIGRDRGIIRGFSEARAAYEERLIDWLTDRKVQGNPFALAKQLRAYCGVPMRVRTVDRRGNWFTIDVDGTRSYLLKQANWDWDGVPASPDFSRFWVFLYPPASLWTPGPNIGELGLWDNAIGSPGFTIGSTATPEQVAAIRSIVRFWQPAGTKCEHIILAFDDASFDPNAAVDDPGMPNGAWLNHGKDSAGDYVIARLESARYWLGAA